MLQIYCGRIRGQGMQRPHFHPDGQARRDGDYWPCRAGSRRPVNLGSLRDMFLGASESPFGNNLCLLRLLRRRNGFLKPVLGCREIGL